MQRWMRILGTAVMAAALAVGTAGADDSLEDFLVLGADPDDFRPGSEAVSSGSLFFVGGSTALTDPFPFWGCGDGGASVLPRNPSFRCCPNGTIAPCYPFLRSCQCQNQGHVRSACADAPTRGQA